MFQQPVPLTRGVACKGTVCKCSMVSSLVSSMVSYLVSSMVSSSLSGLCISDWMVYPTMTAIVWTTFFLWTLDMILFRTKPYEKGSKTSETFVHMYSNPIRVFYESALCTILIPLKWRSFLQCIQTKICHQVMVFQLFLF